VKTILGKNPEGAVKVRLLMTAFLAGLLFSLLAIIVQYPVVTTWETELLWQIHQWHNAILNKLNLLLAYLGGMPGMIIIMLMGSVVAFCKKRTDFIGFGWAAFLGAMSIGWLCKAGFSRLRPAVWEQIAPFYGDSFPSNHSLYAITLAGMLLVMTFNTPWRTLVLLSGTVWSMAMGLSRLYLGAHFPTDVLAGWSLGIAWLGLLSWLFIHFSLFRLNPFQSNHFQHRASRFAGNHEV
jgi:undecaprenyl-diphosphatase